MQRSSFRFGKQRRPRPSLVHVRTAVPNRFPTARLNQSNRGVLRSSCRGVFERPPYPSICWLADSRLSSSAVARKRTQIKAAVGATPGTPSAATPSSAWQAVKHPETGQTYYYVSRHHLLPSCAPARGPPPSQVTLNPASITTIIIMCRMLLPARLLGPCLLKGRPTQADRRARLLVVLSYARAPACFQREISAAHLARGTARFQRPLYRTLSPH